MQYTTNIIGTIGIMSGIPSLPTPFVQSLVDMINYNHEFISKPGEQIEVKYPDTSYHSQARNELAFKMQGNWIVMLDTDHVFPPDTVGRLLWIANKYKIDVVSGFYQQKKYPFLPAVYSWDGDGMERIVNFDDEITEIGAAGAGCLFVRGSVFKRIVTELGEPPFNEIAGNSEDISFFRRLAKLDIRAYCVRDLCANHIRWQEVVPDMQKGHALSLTEAI